MTVRLTIGLPTFNGARFLQETLEQIERQTYRDFIVVISDNASTDATPDIAKKFVQRDSRFRYQRHEAQIDVQQNYIGLLRSAETALFIWRPDDDVWPPNYLEKLVALFETSDRIMLAVPKSIEVLFSNNQRIVTEFRPWGQGDFERMRVLDHCPETWVYGIFDRRCLLCVINQMQSYKGTRAWGLTILFHFILKNLVAGTNETYFQWMGYVDQGHVRATGELRPETKVMRGVAAEGTAVSQSLGKIGRAWTIFRLKTAKKLSNVDTLLNLRREAFRLAYRWICEEVRNPLRRLMWRLFLYRWIGRRLYQGRRAFKYKLLHAITHGSDRANRR